ncbi:flavoprotein [Propionicimonas sp.]|uniref:flavoprotein n=1 Tax=Propionicimonas sp. TaxID=1955623 RepID=UPI0039E4A25D
MTEADLKLLVQASVLEAMAPRPRRALVLFTGGLLGFEDAVESLRRLAATGVSLDYVQTPSAENVLDQTLIAGLGMQEVSRRMVAEHDMLIAPTLTANIAGKVAHGIADCKASNLFSEFIMANRLVVASRTAICPDGAAKQSWFPEMPSGYADLLRANLRALASFGVRLPEARFLCRTALAAWDRRDGARRAPFTAAFGTSVAGLARSIGLTLVDGDGRPEPKAVAGDGRRHPGPAVVACAQPLVSQQVVQQVPRGVELRVASRALVTAAARDAAAARSIRISREV